MSPQPDHSPEAIGRLSCRLVARYLAASRIDLPAPQFLPRIERFATSLALWGRHTNLTARPDDPTELAFHIIDSVMPLVLATRHEAAALRELFDPARSVLDLGSGAGFPGLILAAAADARFVLLEGRRKRAHFLAVTAAAMGVANVTVEASRRDPAQLAPTFDIVVGRAFARPGLFGRSAAAALRPGGIAILYATTAQAIDPADAAGLLDGLQLPYEVPGRDTSLARRLLVWRKAS
jgi:16S rRNA G527 N7-methylase RsmG